MTKPLAWRPSAAYLYVLHLDAVGLAWEYLRRNPDYQTSAPGDAQHWGLFFPGGSEP